MASSSLNWSAMTTGSENIAASDPFIGCVRKDASGNIYTVSNATAPNLDPVRVCNADGSVFGSFIPTAPTTMVLVKRNSSGVTQWYVTADVNASVGSFTMDVDSNHNVYFGTWIYGNTTFRGTNATTMSVSRNGNALSACIAKYNSAGVIQNAVNPMSPIGTGNSLILSIQCYGADVYVVGQCDANTGFNILNLTGTTFRSIGSVTGPMVIKYGSNGIATVALQCFNAAARPHAIDIDSSGNVYVGGRLDFSSTSYTAQNYVSGTESSSGMSITSSTAWDGFLIKYNSSFTTQWVIGFTGTASNDVPVGVIATSTGVYVSAITGSTSLSLTRNNGSITSLGTVTLTAGGGVLFSFSGAGALTWTGRFVPTTTGNAFPESMVVDSNGDLYISGNCAVAGVSYISPSNVTTTITKVGTFMTYLYKLNSSGVYQTHWYIKNIIPYPYASLGTVSSDLAVINNTDLMVYVTDTGLAGLPSLKSLLNNTLVVAFSISTNSVWTRILDFCSGNTVSSYLFLTGNGAATNQFRFAGRWSFAGETLLNTGVTTTTNQQYVLTMNIQAATAVFFIYSWNGSSVTQVYTGTMTYSNGGGSNNPLNQLRALWFGRSAYAGDSFMSGSFQKILMCPGQISTPSTTLPLIFTNPVPNTASGSIYTFGAATGFTSLSVTMNNSPSFTTSAVTLAGGTTKQYLALTGLTMLEEDATRLYDASNNLLGTLPPSGQTVQPSSSQTGVLYLSTGASAGTITGTSTIGFNTTTVLTATGSVGTLQWQFSPNNSTWTDISEATSTTYTTVAQTGGIYYYRVRATFNGSTVNSASFTLTVNAASVAGTISVSFPDQNAGFNTTKLLTLTGSVGSIQWQTWNGTSYVSITGATSSTYTTPGLTLSSHLYRAVVTNGVSALAIATPVTINVDAQSVAGTITGGNRTVQAGETFTLTLTGNTGTIQWQISSNDSTWTNISGATGSTYATPQLYNPLTYYRVVVKNGNSAVVNSTSVLFTINALFQIGSAYAGGIGVSGIPWSSQVCKMDPSGNMYLAGQLINPYTLSGQFNNYVQSVSGRQVLITKLDSSGNVLFATQVGTGAADNNDIFGMTYDSQGNMYVAGQTFLSGFTISGPNGGFVKSTHNNFDGYFAKYNASGKPVWGRLINGSGGNTVEGCYDITSDNNDNLYMFTTLQSSSGFTLSGTITSFTTIATTNTSIVSQLEATSGQFTWHQGFNSAGLSQSNPRQATRMKVANNVLYAGVRLTYASGLTISGVSGGFTATAGLALDTFMAMNTTNGQINWARCVSGTAFNQFDVDFSGNIVAAGSSSTSGMTISGLSGNVTKTTTTQQSLLVKFNPVGVPIWTRLSNDAFSWADIVVDANGNIITKAPLGTSLTFNGTFGSTTGNMHRTNMYDTDGVTLLWSQMTSGAMLSAGMDVNRATRRNELLINGLKYAIRPIVATTICGHTPNVGTSLSRRLFSYGNVGSIQWQQSADSASWSDIVGATQDAFVVQNASASTFYRVTVTGQVSGSLFTGSGQRLIVDPPSVAGSISGAVLIQKGTSTTLTIAGNTGTLQWQSSTDGVSWANIASATAASYTTTRLLATTHFRVAVTNLQSPTVFTSGLMITTSDLSNPGGITGGNVDVLYGAAGPTLTVVGNTGTIQWQSSANNNTWANISGATASSYATGTMIANTYYRVVVTNGSSPAANSVSVGVFVDNNKRSITEVVTATNLDSPAGTHVQFNDVSMDAEGNMFVVGNTGLSGFTLSGANGGFTTVNVSGHGFVAKYNASGVVDWARLIGAGTYIVPTSVFNDANGRTHIVGRVSGAAGSISGLSGNVNYDSRSTFYAQVNATGTLAWSRLLSSDFSWSYADKVFVNASNLICIVNHSGDSTNLFTMNMCGLSGRIAGSLFWAGGVRGTDIPYAGAMDSSGNMWLTGQFNSQATVSGVSGTIAIATAGQGGMFASYINASGVNQWNILMGNRFNAGVGTGVAIDQSGNSYFTGYVRTAITISGLSGNFVKTISGNNSMVLVKYNRAGSCLWANYVGSIAADNETVNNLAADAAGNVWLAGFTQSSGFTMSGLSGGFVKVNTAQEGFIANYNANGTLQWAQLIRGYGKTLATGVALNVSAGKFVIVGNTNKFGAGNLNFTISGRSTQSEMVLYNYDGFGNFISNAIIAISGARAHAINQSGSIAVISSQTGRDIGIFNNAGAVLNRFTTNSGILVPTAGTGIGFVNDFIYYTGIVNTASLTVSGLSGGFTKAANTNTEFCLTCYDTTGNLMWSRLTGINTTMYESKFDYSGNSYVFGRVSGSNHMRIEKWLPNGTLGWGTNIGYAAMTSVSRPSFYVNTSGFIGITYATTSSGVTLSGVFGGTTSSGSLSNVYVGQMNQSGVVIYGRQIERSGGLNAGVFNLGNTIGTNKLIGDASGNLYATATCNASGVTFLGGAFANFTTGTDATGFIQKYDSSGSLVWGRIIGFGSGFGGSVNVVGSGIDPSGNVTFMMNAGGSTTIIGTNRTITPTGTYNVTFNMSGNIMNVYQFDGNGLGSGSDNNNLFVNLSGTFTGLNYLTTNNLTSPIARTTVSGIYNGFLNSYNLRALGGVIGGNDVNLAFNTSRTLTVVGSYGSLQWQTSADGVTYSDIPTANSTSYTTPNLTAASTFYRVQVTDDVNGFNATSAVAQVIVDPESVAGTIAGAETTAGYNTGKTLTLTGSVGTAQWQSSVDNVTFSNIPGATSTTYITPNLISNLFFRAVVTSGVNSSVNSAAVQVVVDGITNPGIITISSVAAGAQVPAPIGTNRVLVLRGYVATSIQWQQSADGVTYSDIGGATSDTYATANVVARVHYRARLQNGNSAAAFTQPLMVVAQVLSPYSSLTLGASIQNTQITNLRSTALDNNGNLFVIGDTNASGFTLSGAQGGFTVSGANGFDAFIAVYNSSGAVQWARLIASAQADTGYGVTTDTSGNVYAVASVGAVGTISGISGGFTKSTTDIDAALIKYSASGTIIMARLIGAAQFTDIPAGLSVDTSGNVFIAGTTNSSGYTLSGVQGGFTTSGSDSNAFVVEYDINGTVQWARLVGALGANDFGYGVSVDPTDGSVYMTGVVATSGYTLSGVSGGFTKTTTDNDAFLSKYSASGVLQYGRVIAGLGADFGFGVSNDTSGNAFVVGYTASSGITLSGSMGGFSKTNTRQTAFLAKYSGAGALEWARQIGVSGVQSAFGVSCDPTGYVWVTGITTESGLTISGVSGGMYKTNNALDSFVASYDSVSGILNRAQLVAGAGVSGLVVAAIAQNTIINRLAIVGGTATTNTDINYAVTLKTISAPEMMVGRVNASGVPLWNTFIGSNTNRNGSIVFDQFGNSYVANYSGALLSIIKYDIQGNSVWSYGLPGASSTHCDLAFSAQTNNLYVTGQSSTSGFTLSGAGISGFTTSGTANNSYVALLSSSGNLQRAQAILNTGNNLRPSIAVDISGNYSVVILAGTIGFTISGVIRSYTKTDSVVTTPVIVRFSSSGVVQWAQTLSASGHLINDITTDPTGQIIVAGWVSLSGFTLSGANGGFTTPNPTNVTFTTALSASTGAVQWAQLINRAAPNTSIVNTTITTDSSGSIYTTDALSSVVTISGISGGFNSTGSTSPLFITKQDGVSGTLHWARLIDRGNSDINGIQTDASGFVYVMAQTNLSGFNASGMFATKATTQNDTYVLKYNPAGTAVAGYYYYNTASTAVKRSLAVDLTGSFGMLAGVSGPFNMYNQPNSTFGFAKQYLINPQPVAGTVTGPGTTVGYNKSTSLYVVDYAGTIQWQSSTDGTTFSNIASATATTYVTPALIASIYYRVVVTNGPASPAISAAVQVVVDAQSVAGTISGNTPNAGYSKTKTLTLADNTGAIQWQSSTDNVTFSNISLATASPYTTPPLLVTQYYRAVVTSGNSDPATTPSVQVQVDAQSVAGTLSGPASNIGYNKTAALTVTGNTGTIAWYMSTDNTNFSVIAEQTSTSYSPTLTATTYFYVTAINGNSDPATSSTVTVTVDEASAAGTITGNRTVVLGANNTTMIVSGYIGQIQWQSSTDNTIFTNIPSATAASYTAVNLLVTTQYRVVATNGASDPATSPVVTMTVISFVKPDPPTAVSGVPRNASVEVSWTAPAFDGNKPILGYIIKAYLDADNSLVSTTTFDSSLPKRTVTGLTNGTAYKFTVSAVNSIDTSDESIMSSAVTPSTTAPAPTNVALVIDDDTGVATVTWTTNPSDNGGSAITGYRVVVQPGNFSATLTGNTTSTTTFNLTLFGALYTATVASINGNGTGAPSLAATDTYENLEMITAVQDSQSSPTAIATYSESVQKTPTELFLELKTTARNQVNQSGVPLTQDQNTRTQIANAVADKADINLASAPVILPLTAAQASILFSASNTSIPLDEVRSTVSVIPPLNETLKTATVDLTALQATLLANGVNLETGVSSSDLHFDIPPGYEMTLIFNGVSRTLVYDGTTLRDKSTNELIALGSIIVVGAGVFRVTSIGSVSFQTLPPYVLDIVGNTSAPTHILAQKGMNIGINNAFGSQ